MTRTTRSGARRDSSHQVHSPKSGTAVVSRPAPAAPTKPVAVVNVPQSALLHRQSVTLPVSHEQIARAAYELWQQRGGSAEQNWLDAEAQLRQQSQLGI